MAASFRALLLAVVHRLALSLLLQPEKAPPVRVLVYGDSWGESGPSYQMLQRMLAAHGVEATVKNSAIGGTRACQWSEDPGSIAKMARQNFPDMQDEGEHLFVWFTLGGNDLLDDSYQTCHKESKSFEEATACLATETTKLVGCSRTLLQNLFKALPKTQVLQCGYDLPCTEGTCNPVERFPFCGMNATCSNAQMDVWQPMLLDSFNKEFQPNYVGINIMGTQQVMARVPGALIGHAVFEKGSPCSMQFGCVHPVPESPAADAIGEQFWEQFFKGRVEASGEQVLEQPHMEASGPRAPTSLALSTNTCAGDIESFRTKCMWNWSPLHSDASLLEKCSFESVLERAARDHPGEVERRIE